MNIKELIGYRIQTERKAKNLTQTVLGERGNFSQSRINNWERGIRTPGLEEAKQLAQILEVSASYLMGLSDRKNLHPLDKNQIGTLVPLLNDQQACNPEYWIQRIKHGDCEDDIAFIPLGLDFAENIDNGSFAFKINDESMHPEFKMNDLLIINSTGSPKPGNFVAAKIEEERHIIIRRYKQLSALKEAPEYELQAINDNWAHIRTNTVQTKIIGSVVGLIRKFKL